MNKPAITVVRGPKGIPICINDLPASNETRWIKSKKEIVASAVRGGLLTIEEAGRRYRLSQEELDGWMERISSDVMAGAQIRGIMNH